MMRHAGFVSCDIVAHSAVVDPVVQHRRLLELNALVRDVLQSCSPGDVIWASGGDGGHIAFFNDDWLMVALQFMTKLRRWSTTEGAELRVVGHCGDVDQFEGADGRVQLVGDGINLVGRLLQQGFPQGIIVTEPFNCEIQRLAPANFRTHEPRVLRLKHAPPQIVYLLSMKGEFESHWDLPAGGIRGQLQQALNGELAWLAILFAKRLLQTNSSDDQAEAALAEIGPHQLVYRLQSVETDDCRKGRVVPNPFLSEMDSESRMQVIRCADLVERRRGRAFCHAGDRGDTMFVVLDGEIGVFPPNAPSEVPSLAPRIAVGPGEVVGELAFALRRPRTASLVALEDTCVLSIRADALYSLARDNSITSANINRFVTGRLLEFVCNSCSYLIGRDGNGPLRDASQRRSWDRFMPAAEKIVCSVADLQPISLADQRFEKDGLYILVSGRLRSTIHPDKVLDESELPLVFVDLPGRVVCANHFYRPEGRDAIILRIGMEAFIGRQPIIDMVADRLLPELPRMFHYDIFLSYTFDDAEVAQRWQAAFESAGLRVYIEVSRTGHYFRDRIESGILDSLILVALISGNTMSRPEDHNWVRHEIDFRKGVFEKTSARIFPVRLRGGNPKLLADGYTVIDAVDREEAAIGEVIEGVRLTRNGQVPSPYSLSRKLNFRL